MNLMLKKNQKKVGGKGKKQLKFYAQVPIPHMEHSPYVLQK